MTRLLTARIVAEQLDVSTEVLLRWVRAGKVPAVKLPGGGIRFREDELERWLEGRAVGVVERRSLTPVEESHA